MDPRERPTARWTVGGVAAIVVGTVTGCAAGPSEASPGGEPPASEQAAQSPGWTEIGGRPVVSPSPDTAAGAAGAATGTPDEHDRSSKVAPMPIPESCAAAGLKKQMGSFADRLAEPDFEEVRTDTRLECSWAGFSQSDGSEVIMVTYTPDRSLVEYPGHIPQSVVQDPSFFTTAEVTELGGVAEWQAGEMFSGVSLHVPGLLVSITTNADEVGEADLLDIAATTAGDLLAEESDMG